jgi:hypothetical protein
MCAGSSVPQSCIDYTIGVLDGFDSVGGLVGICIPQDATNYQLGAVIKQWIARNPQRYHEAAAGLVAAALMDAFPCN